MRRMLPVLIALLLALTAVSAAAAEENAEEPKVKSLAIVREPDKTVYFEGEIFDPTGIVINATLEDGTVLENVAYKCRATKPLTLRDRTARFHFGGINIQQKITVKNRGNMDIYSVANTEALADSPLKGKVILWLGSSVTFGTGSEGESMVHFLDKKHGTVSINLAVPGTTLAGIPESPMGKSYIVRLEEYIASPEKAEHIDGFICQLSTNDMNMPGLLDAVTPDDVRDPAAFDRTKTFGSMETIICLVRETWDCPIWFYTGSYFEHENYAAMVEGLHQIAAKWDIGVIDLYSDTAFNDVTPEDYSFYMTDRIHPTRAGYRDWWLPKFEEALSAD